YTAGVPIPVLHLPQIGCHPAPLRRGSDRPIGPIQTNGGSIFISDPARSEVRLLLSPSLTATHGRQKSSKLIPIGYGVGQIQARAVSRSSSPVEQFRAAASIDSKGIPNSVRPRPILIRSNSHPAPGHDQRLCQQRAVPKQHETHLIQQCIHRQPQIGCRQKSKAATHRWTAAIIHPPGSNGFFKPIRPDSNQRGPHPIPFGPAADHTFNGDDTIPSLQESFSKFLTMYPKFQSSD
ncbi:hypothetical protein ACLOJK_018842, partial [Asimina triloba]